ncbi:hypothetical protein GCM10027059_14260 [Myceligenerans halotolerans]
MSAKHTHDEWATPEEGAALSGLLREHGAGARPDGQATLAEELPAMRRRVHRRRVAKAGGVAGALAVAGVLAVTGSQAAEWIRSEPAPLPGGVTVEYQDGYVPDGWKGSGASCGMPVTELEDLAEPAGLAVAMADEPAAYREREGWWVPATISGPAAADALQEPFLVWSQDGTVVDLGWSYATDGAYEIPETVAADGEWWGPVRAQRVTGCLPAEGADAPFDDDRYQHVREAGRFDVRVAVRTTDGSGTSGLYLSEPQEIETPDGAGGPVGGPAQTEPGSSWAEGYQPDWLAGSDVACLGDEDVMMADSRADEGWTLEVDDGGPTSFLGRWQATGTLMDGVTGGTDLPYAPPTIMLFDEGRLVGYGHDFTARDPVTDGNGWGSASSNAMNSCRRTTDGETVRIPEGDYTARLMIEIEPGDDTYRFVWSDPFPVHVAEDGDLTAR